MCSYAPIVRSNNHKFMNKELRLLDVENTQCSKQLGSELQEPYKTVSE